MISPEPERTYQDGLAEGHELGLAEGAEVGFHNGKHLGVNEGYSVGYEAGVDFGHDDAWVKATHNERNRWAKLIPFASNPDAAEAWVLDAVDKSGAVAATFSDGFNQGYDAGYSDAMKLMRAE